MAHACCASILGNMAPFRKSELPTAHKTLRPIANGVLPRGVSAILVCPRLSRAICRTVRIS